MKQIDSNANSFRRDSEFMEFSVDYGSRRSCASGKLYSSLRLEIDRGGEATCGSCLRSHLSALRPIADSAVVAAAAAE